METSRDILVRKQKCIAMLMCIFREDARNEVITKR